MLEIIIQGIFEAFPISSSLHLALFRLKNAEIMHIGTSIAFLIYTISTISVAKIKKLETIKYLIKIALLIAPTICLGWYIKKQPQNVDPYLANLIFAILMLYSNQFEEKRTFNSLSIKEILIMSILLTSAFIPGASRLGTAFTTFRFFSINKEEAFFSAIIVGIPVTLGAGMVGLITQKTDVNLVLGSLLAGFLTYHTLKLTHKYLKYWNGYVVYRILFSLVKLYWKTFKFK